MMNILKCLLIGFTLYLYSISVQILPAYADKVNHSSSGSYLSIHLKQIIKSIDYKNRGLNYFVLPSSSELDKIPADPQNPLTIPKIKLGQLLFHETALSIHPLNPKYWQHSSCASCHFAQAGFRSNLDQGLGVGGLGWNQDRHRDPDAYPTQIDKQNILTPSVLNSAYQSSMLWDGRLGVGGANNDQPSIENSDVNRFKVQGLEAQAIDGLIAHRMGTAAIVDFVEYQKLFAEAFPDRPYVKAEVEDIKRSGLAIAAYERTLLANEAPFQQWLKGDENAMSQAELRGATTFFTSSCIQCHSGANLATSDFRSVGFVDHPEDFTGLNLGRGAATKQAKDDFKFKIPQLYNLADSSPYGHGASFKTIRAVVEYFNEGTPQNLEPVDAGNLSVWFRPLHLSPQTVDDLVLFLETSLHDPNLTRYVPDKLPSGLCFPNNDSISRQMLDCK
jgi:cytochrome c peroxidase